MRITPLSFFFLLFTSISVFASLEKGAHLTGQIELNLTEGTINSNFEISEYQTKEKSISFAMNYIIEVNQISINGTAVKYDKTNEDCADCIIYTIAKESGLKATDKIKIETSGKFVDRTGINTNDYKGMIAYNSGIFRAAEQAKWYPVLIDKPIKNSINLRFYYTYKLDIDCPECAGVFIGEGLPIAKSGTFSKDEATDAILLIAGNIKWEETEDAIYINVKSEEQIENEKIIKEVKEFYGQLTGNPPNDVKLVMANLPTDNPTWEGFVTEPVMVNTLKEKRNEFEKEIFLSHEIAHYYFGKVYKPKSNLYWFFLESGAEYFSYKYLLNKHGKVGSDYHNLKRIRTANYIPFVKTIQGNDFRFVKLKKIKDPEEISILHRYNIGGFQLLGIEHEIGEEKMLEFIDLLFQQINEKEHGFTSLQYNLMKLGITEKEVKRIEKKYFRKIKMRHYRFLEDLKIN